MKLYTKLHREQFLKLNEESRKYPTITKVFIDKLKEETNIYNLSLYDSWDLAKLIGAVDGTKIDMLKLIRQFCRK